MWTTKPELKKWSYDFTSYHCRLIIRHLKLKNV